MMRHVFVLPELWHGTASMAPPSNRGWLRTVVARAPVWPAADAFVSALVCAAPRSLLRTLPEGTLRSAEKKEKAALKAAGKVRTRIRICVRARARLSREEEQH